MTVRRAAWWALSAALAVVGGLQARVAGQSPAVTAFVDVTVVPMDRERAVPGQTVIVRGDRIAEIGPSATVRVPDDARRIDGRGKFLMPGVAEMHAHVPGANAPPGLLERTLRLFLANGVTTIRGMLGDPTHLPLRAMLQAGETVGPRLYTSGPSLNGASAATAEMAVAAVRAQKAAGYDFLKIHPGIRRDVFDALAAEAERVGIRFAGHVPADVGIARALATRFWSIDHADGYFEGAVRAGAPVDARVDPGFFGTTVVGHLDDGRLKALVAETKRQGVWIVPTQGLMELFLRPDTPEQLMALPGVDLMPASVRQGWVTQRSGFLAEGLPPPAVVERFLAERRRLLKAMHDAGVDLALGSDAIQTFSVPGFSLQHEMAAMVRAGLTPYQVYVTGTRNVARFFGQEREVGTVEAGKVADLVLLEADPLADVANFAKQTGTMVRGRWYDRVTLLAELRSSLGGQ